MSDLISRQNIADAMERWLYDGEDKRTVREVVYEFPSAEPDTWMEQNRERILQAGMEGREVEFRIGGRLFAIREKAQ